MAIGTTAAILGGASLIGGAQQASAARSAQRSGERAGQAGIEEQRAARESFEQRTQPFADIGLSAASPLAQLLGLQDPAIAQSQARISEIDRLLAQPEVGPQQIAPQDTSRFSGLGDTSRFTRPAQQLIQQRLSDQQQAAQQTPAIDRGALEAERAQLLSSIESAPTAQQAQQSQIEQINPVLSFLRQQGFEDIQESAAARGRLGAGGTLRDLTEFNTQLSATIVPQLQQQRFSQLFNVLGLGANAATGQGQAGLQTASNIGNLFGNIGQAQAQGAINQSNAITGGIGNLAGIYGADKGGAFNFANK